MPRIILQPDDLNLDPEKKQSPSTGFRSDRDILKKRSKKYVETFSKLDAKTLTETRGMTAELTSLPLGIVSKCFLGDPFEVHTLDLGKAQIIHHYKRSEPMPAEFEKARNLAMHNAYAFIEVYTDKLVMIREDGTAAKL